MFCKYLLAKIINLDLGDTLHSRTLQAQIKTTYASEQ